MGYRDLQNTRKGRGRFAEKLPGSAEAWGSSRVTEAVDVTAKVVNAASDESEVVCGNGTTIAKACGDAGVAWVVAEVGKAMVLLHGVSALVYATVCFYETMGMRPAYYES